MVSSEREWAWGWKKAIRQTTLAHGFDKGGGSVEFIPRTPVRLNEGVD